MKLGPLALTLVASVLPTAAAANAGTPGEHPRMDLRVSDLAAPLLHKPGEHMPVYVSYGTQTSFSGFEGPRYLREPMWSNTVSIPRSTLGGPASYEWKEGWGVIYGPGPIHPTDERVADNLYVWANMPPTVTAHGGEDLGHTHMWFTDHQPWASDPAASEQAGTLAWDHQPGWSSSVETRTHQYARVAFSEGTTVSAPVATNFGSAMHLDHAFLEARGGDVAAPSGGIAAPPITLGGDEPVGSDMAFQMLHWVATGSYSNVSVTPDWTAGRVSAMQGKWRLPVSVTLPEGDRMPQRRDREDVATPQYTLPLTALGIPEDENGAPGEQAIRLVTDLRPGERIQGVMAVRQPDGSLRTSPVLLDEPGPRTWRVEGGRLVPDAVRGDAYALQGEDGDEGGAAGILPEAGDEPIPADGPRFETNAAGRVVARDVRYGHLALLDSFDVARVHTERGTIELGPHNRDGHPVIVSSPDGHETWSRTAYMAEGVFIVVEMVVMEDNFAFYLETHPLDGGTRPYRIESVADPGDAMRLSDALLGPLERATVLLDAEVPPVENVPLNGGRLLIGDDEMTVTAITDAGGARSEVEVRNRPAPAAGEPLSDPVIVARTAGPLPFTGPLVYPFYAAVDRSPKAQTSGRFTGMRTYRLARQRGDVLGETRDLDGAEPFGIAFTAVNAAGQPLARSAITSLYVDVRTSSGKLLFQRTLKPTFSPDAGASWGVSLVPVRELDPADVVVYARATHAGGVVRTEASPAVPSAQWTFRIDRLPLAVTDTAGGLVRGTTEPRSTVQVRVPELGRTARAVAGSDGTFAAQVDMSSAPGGEYEVVVEVTGPWAEDPEKAMTSVFWPNMTDTVPDDERAVATARLRHVPGGADPSSHRTGPPIDEHAAEAFLESRDGLGHSLRTTAWTVRALGAHGSAGAEGYLHSLARAGGFGWRAGEAPSSSATGLGAEALARLGRAAEVDAGAFLRWDGGAAAAPHADVSSLEATARLVLGLDASGRLDALDPWWRTKISRFLIDAVPASPQGSFERIAALGALGAHTSDTIDGSDLDSVAYRVLLGAQAADDLARFQTHAGGFTFRPDGDTAEALPTALALAAARS